MSTDQFEMLLYDPSFSLMVVILLWKKFANLSGRLSSGVVAERGVVSLLSSSLSVTLKSCLQFLLTVIVVL